MLHVHEPVAPSLSLLALMVADGPIVATFHTANPRSRLLTALPGVLQPFMEKITGRIAVSELARQVQVEHLGGDAVIIPNGVDVQFFAGAGPLPGYPRTGGTIGFVGRFDEPRKGMSVLLDALRLLVADTGPTCSCWWPAAATRRSLREDAGRNWRGRCGCSAGSARRTRRDAAVGRRLLRAQHSAARASASSCTEAMAPAPRWWPATWTPFRRVLDGGEAGVLFRVGDPTALAGCLAGLLDDPAPAGAAGRAAAAGWSPAYDWPVVAATVVGCTRRSSPPTRCG